MYNIDYKKYHKELIIGFILLIVGILFTSLYMDYIFKGALKKLLLDEKIEAINIDINKMTTNDEILYSPVYTFKVNDRIYYCEVKNASKIKPNKKETLVYYKKNDPNNCINEYEATPSIYSYVILFFPLFSIALGLFAIVLSLKDITNLNKLQKNGTLIKNIIYKIEEIELKKRKFIKVIKIDYKLNNDKIVQLISDIPKKDTDLIGYIDLLIDENNLNNFYINFDIEKTNI